MKKSLLLSAAVLVISLGLVHGAEAHHSWGGYHWARAVNPFTISLGDNLTPAWDSYLTQTSADWSISTVLDTTIVAGKTNDTKGKNTPKNCTPTQGRGEICNERYGNNGWLGIASIWASGTHITAGTVKMNDSYFSNRTYNTPAWKNLVMCQEVGHIFGLDHQDEIFDNTNLSTCMDYTNNPESNQHPNAHDYEMLESIYSHLDASTTIKSALPASLLSDSNDPAAWGKEVHRSEDGRTSVFVKDLGKGNKVLHHVYWAEPREHHE